MWSEGNIVQWGLTDDAEENHTAGNCAAPWKGSTREEASVVASGAEDPVSLVLEGATESCLSVPGMSVARIVVLVGAIV